MRNLFQRARAVPALLLALLLFMAACSGTPSSPGPQTTSTPGNGQGASATATALAQNGGTPGNNGGSSGTDTSCPTAGTGRAAVMPPFSPGSHQNLVYVYNEVSQNTSTSTGHVRRYDTATGKKTDIETGGIRIDQAQVSRDGQWVLFLKIPDPRDDSQHSALLQLVRVDGQELQTLYCFPSVTYTGVGNSPRLPISIQWSTDQHLIVFSSDTNNDTSTISLLNITNGNVTVLMNQHDTLYDYSVLTWLDQAHVYVLKEGISAPTPPATLFLMDSNTATPANPNLVNIATTDTRFSFFSFDSSPDGTKLYSSYCLNAGNPFNSNISVGPATGGARSVLLQESPAVCVLSMRVISAGKLLLLVRVLNAVSNGPQVWTMNVPGASSFELTALPTSTSNPFSYDFNETSQFTAWSNVSRDGSTYALQEINPNANTQSILTGSLSGGAARIIATTGSGTSTVSLAGWITI